MVIKKMKTTMMHQNVRKTWNLIEKNHALLVDENGHEKIVQIAYDETLNARDPVKNRSY